MRGGCRKDEGRYRYGWGEKSWGKYLEMVRGEIMREIFGNGKGRNMMKEGSKKDYGSMMGKI